MEKILLFLITIIPLFFTSQTINIEDELVKKMCSEFSKTDQMSDSVRVANVYGKFLYPYLEKFEKPKIDSIAKSIYFRFQRECEAFSKFLDKVDPQQNWQNLSEIPKTELPNDEKDELLKIKNFYYLEGDSQITKVKVTKNFWTEEFPDKTFSKNKIIWKDDNIFELEFIESNNEGRKGFSRKGDTYYYKIISKDRKNYNIVAKITNQDRVLMFKLFYN